MTDNAWTLAEEALLICGFRAGIAPDEIARVLRKTPGSVRWKLNRLGLVAPPGAPRGKSRQQAPDDTQHRRDRRGDLAFKRAMLRAIRAGAERVEPRVIKSRVARYVRRVIPALESGYRSSAGQTADLGVDRGGTNRGGGG
jgi:hypothetical protein